MAALQQQTARNRQHALRGGRGRATRCVPRCVAAPLAPAAAEQQQVQAPQQAPLIKFKAHAASVTSLAVLHDGDGLKRIVTASLDKSLAAWTLQADDNGAPTLQCTKLDVAGGPVFSLHRGIRSKVTDANVKPSEPVLFCGLAAKEIAAFKPDTLTFSEQMRMNGHTGWVRSLASSGKYLFSCGCNHLRQWDQAYAVPKEVRDTALFTGDILALAANERCVFTAGADGSLRAWTIGKLGELSEAAVRDKAHEGRVTALAVSGSLLFSAGYDGHIKAWDVKSLKLVMEAKAAHGGERVRALVMGPGSGGNAGSRSSSRGGSPSSTPAASAAPSPAPQCIFDEPAQEPGHGQEQGQGQEEGQEPAAHQEQHEPAAAAAQEQAGLVVEQLELAAVAASLEQPQPPQHAEQQPQAAPELQAQPEAELLPPEPEPLPPQAQQAPEQQQQEQQQAGPEAQQAPQKQEQHEQPQPEPAAAAPPAPAPASPAAGLAVLYSGGDDGRVRAWDARLLAPIGEPLAAHSGAVKALAAGDGQLLVSGDAAGEVALWLVQHQQHQ